MSTFAPCADCSGQIVVGQYWPITVPRLDDEGWPTLGPDGRVVTISLPLPVHKANTLWAEQVFDPTGMAPAPCAHGLAEHPTGLTHPWAKSWIRAKYLDVTKGGVFCPVCLGQPAPADFVEPRA